MAFEILKEHGVFYADFNRVRRLKLVDEQHIQENKETPQGVIDTCPIYCFAYFGGHYRCLSLRAMYSHYNSFVGCSQFDLKNSVMFELEVPESFILNTKLANDSYMDYVGMPEGTLKRDRWKYSKVVRESEIVYENHLQYARETNNNDIESLIPYVAEEYVVAVRTFKGVEDEFVGYGTCAVETIYTGSGAPLWTETIYVNGDGYPRVMKDGKVVKASLDKISELSREYGMYAIYPYMTIEEICSSCAGFIIETVGNKVRDLGLEYRYIKHLTYNDLDRDWRTQAIKLNY